MQPAQVLGLPPRAPSGLVTQLSAAKRPTQIVHPTLGVASTTDRRSVRERLGEVNREWRVLYKIKKTKEVREQLKRLNEQRIELVVQIVKLAPHDQSNPCC